MSTRLAAPRAVRLRPALPALAGLIALLVAGPAARAADPVAPAAAAVHWPDLEIARHARAWIEAFDRGEEAMKEVYERHYSPEALASRPVPERLAGYREMRSREGGFTVLAIPEVNEDGIEVRVRNREGRILTLSFEGESEPPHRIRGIRVMMGGGPDEDGGPGAGPGGPPLTDAEALRAMREVLARAAAADSFSGAVLVARDGKPLLREAWNLADRASGAANRPETRFNLGSINKVFTKLAVAQLVAAGKLRLDDPLTRWLPDWPGASAAKITVGMLVEHRSGIPDIFGPRYEAADRSTLRHNRDYLPLFRDEPLWFEPGTSRRYSNGGYVLLGEIIARASGRDYADYVREHIWTPAGMASTGYPSADGAGIATGYTRGEDGRGPLVDNRSTRPARGSAAGGGYSTLDDLLRFDRALLAHRLCDAGWTGWVVGGGPPPTPGATVVTAGAPGFAFAGGAPGISAEYEREGPITLIVLGNFDPPFTRAVAGRLRAIVRRMKG